MEPLSGYATVEKTEPDFHFYVELLESQHYHNGTRILRLPQKALQGCPVVSQNPKPSLALILVFCLVNFSVPDIC